MKPAFMNTPKPNAAIPVSSPTSRPVPDGELRPGDVSVAE
jgi:hypothetical protein